MKQNYFEISLFTQLGEFTYALYDKFLGSKIRQLFPAKFQQTSTNHTVYH